MMDRAENAVIDLQDALKSAKEKNPDSAAVKEARALHRKALWRVDFVNSENSLGFHAPQEAVRILGEAIDYSRQGQIKLLSAK